MLNTPAVNERKKEREGRSLREEKGKKERVSERGREGEGGELEFTFFCGFLPFVGSQQGFECCAIMCWFGLLVCLSVMAVCVFKKGRRHVSSNKVPQSFTEVNVVWSRIVQHNLAQPK